MDTDVVVVGAGHNGLVAATYLARAGLDVTVVERRSFVGGACVTEELWPGLKFSTCAHMTHGLHPKILRDLRFYERGMEIIPRSFNLKPLPDGTYYGPADHESPNNRTRDLTEEERRGQAAYSEFRRRLREMFAPYRLQPPPSLEEMRAAVQGTSGSEALEMALTMRLSELREHFLPSERLKDRFADEAAAVGRDPLGLYLAYASLNQPEQQTGESPPHGYVRGGMGTVSRLACEAAEEAGSKILLDSEVSQFLVEGDRVTGIRFADGTTITAKVVLSNLDPKRTFLKLMPEGVISSTLRERIAALVSDVSCYKFLAAISELPRWEAWDGDPELPSKGAVVLNTTDRAIAAAYNDFDAGRPPAAPRISVSIPSAADESLTKPGYHTASVWIVPAPARLSEGSWESVRSQVTDGIIDEITRYAPNFRDSVEECILRTPLDLERENGLTDGCIWHIQHGGEQLFWNRPLPELSRYRAPLAGLYLCGAGQHPGGEVSGIPGHNAAHEVLKDRQF